MTHNQTLRVRIRSRRHPYGHQLYTYEVYDTARPEGHQVLTMGGWHPSWTAAKNTGLADLRAKAGGPRDTRRELAAARAAARAAGYAPGTRAEYAAVEYLLSR